MDVFKKMVKFQIQSEIDREKKGLPCRYFGG